MVNSNKLLGKIKEEQMTQYQVAEKLGISQQTFRNKLRRGVFNSDEIYAMVELLNIENPVEIFFAK